jgi:signal transduction histidine kinase
MTEGAPPVHRSVFGKLVAIMLVMAFCIMGLVFGFFLHFVNPIVSVTVDRMLSDYGRRLANDTPDLAEARYLAGVLKVQIRYEGPDGAWTTDERLPSIAEVARTRPTAYWARPVWGQAGYLASAPNGGRYFFAWEFGQRASTAHDRLLLMLLASMIVVFFAAHLVMTRALRPLRALQDGVARLSAGDLDVLVEHQSRDEFGLLTDAFNRMAARVRDMVRARDQLLMDVSHELRSPLTRMKVALALLPDSAKKSQAEGDVAVMDALTTQLLERERLRDGRALRPAHVDLVPLLHEAARPYQDAHPGVEVSTSAGAVEVDLDVDAVHTVLGNLLDNAVKYSLPDSRPVRLTATREPDAVVVRIVDDGPGIPVEDRASIFEPFFRVDRSRSRKTGGFGLGLSICKRIAEAHRGRLEASANGAGRGTTFTLTLPAS